MKHSIFNSRKLSILFIGLFWIYSFQGFPQEIQMETISISNGLASPQVWDVMQDSYGLIWVGTANGIQRYDGYSWKNYRNIIGDSTSLQSNRAFDIEEDKQHNLWVANELGVSFFDRAKNTFRNYDFKEIFENATLGRVVDILCDSQGRIWASTVGQDIVQYNAEKDKWARAPFANINGQPASHDGFSVVLYEDAEGTIWGGSFNGLMSMPKDYKTFSPVNFKEENDFNTLENAITELYRDKNGVLWISSRQGIYKYDQRKNELKTIIKYAFNNSDLSTYFNSIKEDREGNIWVLNNSRGVLKFKGNKDEYEEIIIPDNRKVSSGGWTIRFSEMILDKSGIFWLASLNNGLFKYDPVNKPFKFYSHDTKNPKSVSPGGTFGLHASKISPGKVYIGTRGNGINILSESNQSIQKVDFASSNDMFGGSARAIYEQEDGTLWVGTWGDGLIKMDANYREIKRYKRDATDLENSLPNDQVRVIREDRSGKLWVGTNGGLTVFDPKTESFNEILSQYVTTYPEDILTQIKEWLDNKQEISIIKNVVRSQELTQSFQITEKGSYYVVWVGEGDPSSMADYGWLQNANGELIVGAKSIDDTFWAGGAIKNRLQIIQTELNPGTYALRYSSDDSHHYNDWNEPEPEFLPLYGIAIFKQEDQIENQSLLVDETEKKSEVIIQDGNISDIEIGEKYIWIASANAGVTRIDPETNDVKYYTSDPADPSTLSSKQVTDVLEDETGKLWMATYGGINILDIATDEITKYTEQDGLSTNILETVLPGENGEMWFSSQNGLIQMVKNEALEKITFINYNQADGIGGDVFLSLAADKTPDGNFYFGGDHGVTTFSTIASNKIPPEVILSNLSISNRSVYDMGKNSPLNTDLLAAKSIQLNHDQNDLSFEFAAIHYANPAKNQYAHKMEGLDQDWIYDNRNFATYTNLETGTYTFRVIASNAYGVWNDEGTYIVITVLPPWWKTWWAYLLYVLVFAVLIFVAYSELKGRIKRKERAKNLEREVAQSKEIEKAYKELQTTQAQLVQQEKLASLGQLTAGIAHEIKNPLNFVNNFSELSIELVEEVKEELRKIGDNKHVKEAEVILSDVETNLKKIHEHGSRADSIVKSMLQHSRGGSGKSEPTDLNTLLKEFVTLSFHGMRASKNPINVGLDFHLDESITKVHLIPEDFSRVIINLCNNAFDAMRETEAQRAPKLSISTQKTEGNVTIEIEDNGAGIPEEMKDKILQPFFTTKKGTEGTGLGLSITNDIVKAHGGELSINSTSGSGSTFIIALKS